MMSSYLPGYALPSVGRAIDVVPPRKVGIFRQGTGRFRPSNDSRDLGQSHSIANPTWIRIRQ